jgi:DNA primase
VDLLVVTEAPLDALSLAAVGVPALALCGTHAPAWLPLVAAFRRVALAFDADGAGDQAAALLGPLLRSFGARPERWRPEGGKDWNELLTRQGSQRLRATMVRLREGELT